MSDRGYANLLNHLHRSKILSLQAAQGSIAYYLAHAQPSPTPLAASVVASSLFKPFSHEKLDTVGKAFRHAVHIKMTLLEKEETSLFLRSLDVRMAGWVRAVMKGLQGGQAMVRVSASAGLLMGLEDFEGTLKMRDGRVRNRVEDELVVALAEVMDLYSSLRGAADWENEFHHDTEGEVDSIGLAFIIAAQALPFVSAQRLTALPLPTFLPSLLFIIAKAFQGGDFLQQLDASFAGNPKPETSPFAASLKSLTSSPIYLNIGPLAKLYARTISASTDTRNKQLWPVLYETLVQLESLSTKMEADWQHNPVVDVTDEANLDPSMRETMSTVWLALKTFLFTAVMITQSITTAITYLPAPSTSLPPSLALIILHTLSRLSFVISQFGGVTSTSQGGFLELKRVFYSALDVLSIDAVVSERFVLELCDTVSMPSQVMQVAKKAFALACVEQLVPTLSESVIEQAVFPLCLPHLSDPAHRETYESAHSVVLAILAMHAQRVGDGSGVSKIESKERPFAERIVPFYTNCLLENSDDGKLVTAQLRLAYSALVRSAGSSGLNAGDALAWFCVQSLLDAVDGKGVSVSPNPEERVHKLHLSLISALSSLPMKLLPRTLERVKSIILAEKDKDKRAELVEATLNEILEKVGDQEKVVVMRWWMENRDEFGAGKRSEETEVVLPRL